MLLPGFYCRHFKIGVVGNLGIGIFEISSGKEGYLL
jgi:hypothetical protein